MNAMTQALSNMFPKAAAKQPKFKQGWSTKLSYRTYQALQKQGIPANMYEATSQSVLKAA